MPSSARLASGRHAIASIVVALGPLASAQSITPLEGSTDAWKPIQINFTGNDTFSELGVVNPFLDRRLDVTFTRIDGQGNAIGDPYVVPGFFNADGRAAQLNDGTAPNPHPTAGNQWAVRFTPDQAGTWQYTASYRQGTEVAIDLDTNAGTAGGNNIDGVQGTFTVNPRDTTADGFLSKGRLAYTGSHYLQTLGDGEYWIKGGADSPENWLGYVGFDSTRDVNPGGFLHDFDNDNSNSGKTHAQEDYNPGVDPAWSKEGSTANDARGIIGAANYLSERGVNSIYFLPMNIGGDAKDTSPFVDVKDDGTGQLNLNGAADNNNTRYDVSKLAQWEVFFAHTQRQGLHLHVVLNEAEAPNKRELDNATLGTERKLFYREMIARFGHHNALQWNISEEYNLGNGFGNNESDEADLVKEFAEYISRVDPYRHPLTVHNAGGVSQSNPAASGPWQYFIGDDDFDLTSLQEARKVDGWGEVVENFRAATAAEGRPIPIMIDEPGSITRDVDDFDGVRKGMLWDILLSGGSVEWFIDNRDQSLEDFREFEQVWRETAIARRFLEDNTKFWLMTPDDDLLDGEAAVGNFRQGDDGTDDDPGEVFALLGEMYALYLPGTGGDGTQTGAFDLTEETGEWFLRWFDPTTGEFVGDPIALTAGQIVDLPDAPSVVGTGLNSSGQDDWAALIIVPAPGSLGLALAGAAVLLTRSRRRRDR